MTTITGPLVSGAVDWDDPESLIGAIAPTGGTPPYEVVEVYPEGVAIVSAIEDLASDTITITVQTVSGIAGSGTLLETGADGLIGSGVVAITASGALLETGQDSLTGLAVLLVSGAGLLLETGQDALASSGVVLISGSGALTETGSDLMSGLAGVLLQGGGQLVETGQDALNALGRLLVSASGSFTETGSDALAGSGGVTVSGEGVILEIGADLMIGVGGIVDSPVRTWPVEELTVEWNIDTSVTVNWDIETEVGVELEDQVELRVEWKTVIQNGVPLLRYRMFRRSTRVFKVALTNAGVAFDVTAAGVSLSAVLEEQVEEGGVPVSVPLVVETAGLPLGTCQVIVNLADAAIEAVQSRFWRLRLRVTSPKGSAVPLDAQIERIETSV